VTDGIAQAHSKVVQLALAKRSGGQRLFIAPQTAPNLAERVGFEKALSDRLFAFNKMPKTDVFTVTYLLSHLEHESQKKR
jgi:hypothetical protein